MFSTHPPTHLFEKNRTKLMNRLPSRVAAIFSANDRMPKNGDQYFPFRQCSNFYYLTGIDNPNSFLLLCPSYPDIALREILFIDRTSSFDRLWTGEKLSIDQAKAVSGINTIFWIDELDAVLSKIAEHVNVFYVTLRQDNSIHTTLHTSDYRLLNKLKELYPLHHIEDARPILSKLRMVKEKEEIELIRKAIDISHNAFLEVIKQLKPGMYEYEIESIIVGVCIKNGCKHMAFDTIVASGSNANILHYTQNDKICSTNDLLLIDFGIEYFHYASDITRTLPVNGVFNKRQKEVYSSVIYLMNIALNLIKPGKTIEQIHREMIPHFEDQLLKLNLITEKTLKQQSYNDLPAYKRYFMHGLSHFLGLDVHDVGDKSEPLQPGMVITCEPGIYIPEEQIGIRLENDILITEKGIENLSAKIPILPEEIEFLMQTRVN